MWYDIITGERRVGPDRPFYGLKASIDKFYVFQERFVTDFEPPNLPKIRSGYAGSQGVAKTSVRARSMRDTDPTKHFLTLEPENPFLEYKKSVD